jgi:aminopeptidase N
MDEGFTSYLEDLGLNEIAEKKAENPHEGSYDGYYYLVKTGKEQPQTTHSDRYDFNQTYGISAYSKGHVFLTQLEYLIGKENLSKTLKKYFNDFKFKHPTPNDFKRTAERISGANLDWYLTDWTQTTNTIDYGIKEVKEDGNAAKISLERIGRMPMPVDVLVEYTDGAKESFYIPLRMMSFEKPNQNTDLKSTILSDWAWANLVYDFVISRNKADIKKITLDPSGLMADVKQTDNVYEKK